MHTSENVLQQKACGTASKSIDLDQHVALFDNVMDVFV